jgi:hypothetical protein
MVMIPADRRVVQPRTAAEFRVALDDAVSVAKHAQSTLKACVEDIDRLREQAASALPAGDVDAQDQIADLQAEIDVLRERQQQLLEMTVKTQHHHARTLCELEEARHARNLGEAGSCAMLLRDIMYAYNDHDFSCAPDSAFDLWAHVLRHRERKTTSSSTLDLTLDRLSQLCGGWWTFTVDDDTAEFVALADWERRYAQSVASSEDLERAVAGSDDDLPF